MIPRFMCRFPSVDGKLILATGVFSKPSGVDILLFLYWGVNAIYTVEIQQ